MSNLSLNLSLSDIFLLPVLPQGRKADKTTGEINITQAPAVSEAHIPLGRVDMVSCASLFWVKHSPRGVGRTQGLGYDTRYI